MNLAEYTELIEQKMIPPSAPFEATEDGYDKDVWGPKLSSEERSERLMDRWNARTLLTKENCMWTLVDMTWTGALADFMRNYSEIHGLRTGVLEVMSGFGHLAKALKENGLAVKATDLMDGYGHEVKNAAGEMNTERFVHQIDRMGAAAAVRRYGKNFDWLLCSWPPYADDAMTRAAEAWGTEKPIIFIGEDYGGCNADDEFYEHFKLIDPQPDIPLLRWWGMHDRVMIGHWSEEKLLGYDGGSDE